MAKIRNEINIGAGGLGCTPLPSTCCASFESRTAVLGVGPAQLSALSVLVFGGNMSLGSSWPRSSRSGRPTMVRIVHGLVGQRLASTRADKEDGRKINIAATARGKVIDDEVRGRAGWRHWPGHA